MILIDPPVWPAHGTVFSHLVSDHSRAELHAFALQAGLPARAFDRDHYDVAERWHDALINSGAVPVSARELVGRLRASGLRRTKQAAARETTDRTGRLRTQWRRLGIGAESLASELLSRWGSSERRYHDQQHLDECLAAIRSLDPTPPLPVLLAAWFHDAVHNGEPGTDEEASARLAEDRLPGVVDAETIVEVARLVRLTAGHAPTADDRNGQMLNDADLSILATGTERYAGYTAGVRAEYHRLPIGDFVTGRSAVLTDLLGRQDLFATVPGRALWETRARTNLIAELELLGSTV